jgi:hypothetical protein
LPLFLYQTVFRVITNVGNTIIFVFPTNPGRIIHREFHEQVNYYLSPAPQALPQAAGFSEGLSEAPQAAGLSDAPQAAGLSDAPHAAGLSDAPQAVPQAEAGASLVFFVHPNKFKSDIICTS